MADENVPPKDLEVRLTELENTVKSLTQALQPTAATPALSPIICVVCHHCYYCHYCFFCGPILPKVETGG